MKETFGDIWQFIGECDAICVTTNGFVKKSGEVVAGRGLAQEAKTRYHTFDKTLGSLILTNGNIVQKVVNDSNTWIVAFPVKPVTTISDGTNAVSHMNDKFPPRSIIPGWAAKADIKLIAKSCLELIDLANTENWKLIYIPQVGCGAGELQFKDVYPLLKVALDDRFSLVTYDVPY